MSDQWATGWQTPDRISANGITLAVYKSGPAPAATDKPAVIFLHGFPELAYSWRAQMAALGAEGYPCLAPDMRGYGASDKPEGRDAYGMDVLTADVTGILDHYGIEKAVAVGHDWGAIVLWALPFYAGDRFLGYAGLNLPLLPHYPMDPVTLIRQSRGAHNYIVQFQEEGRCEPVLGADPMRTMRFFMRRPNKATIDKEAARAEKEDVPFEEESLDLIGLLKLDDSRWGGAPLMEDDDLRVYADAFGAGGFTAPLHWYRNLTENWRKQARFVDADGHLPRVPRPCLMITAELDRACPPHLADGMEERCHSYRRIDLAGCGHWSQQERATEVNDALLDWLADEIAG